MAFVDGLPRPEPLRQIPPLHTGPDPVEHPVDHPPVITPPAPTSTTRRQERHQLVPLRVRQIPTTHTASLTPTPHSRQEIRETTPNARPERLLAARRESHGAGPWWPPSGRDAADLPTEPRLPAGRDEPFPTESGWGMATAARAACTPAMAARRSAGASSSSERQSALTCVTSEAANPADEIGAPSPPGAEAGTFSCMTALLRSSAVVARECLSTGSTGWRRHVGVLKGGFEATQPM